MSDRAPAPDSAPAALEMPPEGQARKAALAAALDELRAQLRAFELALNDRGCIVPAAVPVGGFDSTLGYRHREGVGRLWQVLPTGEARLLTEAPIAFRLSASLQLEALAVACDRAMATALVEAQACAIATANLVARLRATPSATAFVPTRR